MNYSYLPELTPLRGVAAVLVVLFHSQIFIYPLVDGHASLFLAKGWLWVDFFFVLSGFILTHVYGYAFRGGVTRVAYWNYLRARFARVYPLHFFTLLWTIAAGTLVVAGPIAAEWNRGIRFILDIRTAPACLLLVQALHLYPTAPMNTVSWSLSTEWWMYLLFPLLIPLLLGGGRARRLVWLLAVGGLYAAVKYWLVPQFGMHLWQRQPATLNTINDFAFLRCAAGFGLGMLTYRWFQLGLWRTLFQRNLFFWVVTAALVLSFHFDVNELLTVALFPLLILATVYNGGSASRLLSTRPAQRLGEWSFSIYMVHMPIFFSYRGIAPLLGWPVPNGFFTLGPDYRVGWFAACIFLAVTLVAASLCYRWLEVPARNYFNGRRAGSGQAASVAG
ncbi:MAG TPA: acyltransferase [Puia sp.]|uniref:acyltransferase family protein n=1 Tax=Puia sp. TaxID=2045100 RepID=UPI002BA37EEF|nr:acyltransferase [Puia sp.]HVU95356.1 acyltransferase [Puia sp.]